MADQKTYQMLINGAWVDASDGKTFPGINPTTEQPWCHIQEATESDVNHAVEAAHHAFTQGPWAKITPTERGKYLRRLAELLAEKSEKLGRSETIDTGKMLKETRWQAKYIAEFFHFYAGCADKVHGNATIDKPDMMTMTFREPLGVVAAVVPWNSQLFLVAVKIGPALAAGNTVVLKASEHASAPMLEFGKLIEEAGFPPGVVNIITGHADPCGKALTSHPLVARISFTGGTGAARHVVRNSAENFAEDLSNLVVNHHSSCLMMPISKALLTGQFLAYSGQVVRAVWRDHGYICIIKLLMSFWSACWGRLTRFALVILWKRIPRWALLQQWIRSTISRNR